MQERLVVFLLSSIWATTALTSCQSTKMDADSRARLAGGNTMRTVKPSAETLGATRKDLPAGVLYVPQDVENLETAESRILEHVSTPGANLDLALEPGVREILKGDAKSNNLNLYFAVDITGSMQININGIKDNIEELVKKLSSRSLNVKIGIVAFRDKIEFTLPATNDMSAVLQGISRMSASGGGNSWEASLLAIEESSKLLLRDHKHGDANAILVVSDNPGHSGNPSNCKIDSLLSTLNSYSAEFQESLRIYGSLQANGNSSALHPHAPCPTLGYAREQFNSILENSLLSVPEQKRGGTIDYPLNADAMLDQLVRLIERTIQDKREVCLSSSLEISEGSQFLNKWTPQSLGEIYGNYVLGEVVLWKEALTSSQVNSLYGKSLVADLKRCCISEEKAITGDFSSCREIQLGLKFVLQK